MTAPTMTTVNVKRLDRLVAWAEKEDEARRAGKVSEWDQGTYARRIAAPLPNCGTACCLAGKVAFEDRVPLHWYGVGSRHYEVANSTDLEDPDGYGLITVHTYAARALGLDPYQASALFDADNTLSVVRELVAAIKQGVTGDALNDLGDALRSEATDYADQDDAD